MEFAELFDIKAEIPDIKVKKPDIKAELLDIKIKIPDIKIKMFDIYAEIPDIDSGKLKSLWVSKINDEITHPHSTAIDFKCSKVKSCQGRPDIAIISPVPVERIEWDNP